MPKLACNGFSMFSAHWRPRLEAGLGRKFRGMDELIAAANPLWAALADHEKREWKDRAKEYKKTGEYCERKRAARRRGKGAQPVDGVPTAAEEEDDYDSDFDPGVPMFRGPLGHVAPPARDAEALAKQTRDRARVRSLLSSATAADVKSARWLLCAVETYGGSKEAPAELALVEWSLDGGLMEEYFRILAADGADGPAKPHGISKAACAGAAEWTTSRRGVLRNLLGRTEPAIAVEQGVGVGLYEAGLPTDALLPADLQGRRWVLVLRAELPTLLSALETLTEEEKMTYDGFPLSPDRFLVLEGVVEALADLADLRPPPALRLGPTTPWDDLEGMYCSFHAPARNAHCAIARARKTAFSAFAALKDAYDLPFFL